MVSIEDRLPNALLALQSMEEELCIRALCSDRPERLSAPAEAFSVCLNHLRADMRQRLEKLSQPHRFALRKYKRRPLDIRAEIIAPLETIEAELSRHHALSGVLAELPQLIAFLKHYDGAADMLIAPLKHAPAALRAALALTEAGYD